MNGRPMPALPMPFTLHYADPSTCQAMLARPDHILAVVGYGAERPADLPAPCHFLAAPLAPASHRPAYEIWASPLPARPCQAGQVTGACTDSLAFGQVILQEGRGVPFEDVIEQAYNGIFKFLAGTNSPEPIRFWNYLAAITGDDQGMERYRRFNTGRRRAYLAHLRQPVPPAASCLGALAGPSVIYFLAAGAPAAAIENPRQISAYNYPALYGPASPSFSRAGRFGSTLFISGTASITGHETRHPGDVQAQLGETILNLRALIEAAGLQSARPEDWAFKIYLLNPGDVAVVEPVLVAAFGAGSQRLYLGAEICRRDLLLEIEAFCGT